MRPLSIALALVLALPLVPPAAQALPTPGIFCDEADAAFGRVFPEAMDSNDYVSYSEAKCGLDLLLAENPDRMRIDVVTQSVGWDALTGGRDTFDVFVVRVSNYASTLPVDDKDRIVFQLSIHGNEKGGREGGLRVIEDLVRGVGYAADHPEMIAYLDHMELLFVFPQPDGWVHEELEYRHNCKAYIGIPTPTGCVETQNFVRTNGNGKDVNRQWPTAGWVREAYEPMGQPEAQGLVAYLKNETNIKYASDIHGMLNPADNSLFGMDCEPGFPPEDVMGFDPTCFANAVADAKGHYVLTMLPAGRQSPKEMMTNTQLAELVKERLNSDPYFAEWQSMPNSLGGVWGGAFNDWGTVWDTIGYTDSGFTSDFYAQDIGLNAPGVDFELSYNHITFDNYYPGAAQRMNAYHVQAVRSIVRSFMDAANQDAQVSLDVKGTRTAFLDNPTVVTNAADPSPKGWAKKNPGDDAWDSIVWRASPNDYFVEMQPLTKDGDAPGILDSVKPGALADLSRYDNLVVAGSAYKTLRPADIPTIKAWVEAGGNLVLTDEAMLLLVDLGLVEDGAVDVFEAYAGATNFVDREHPLAAGIRGLARETYEPVPLGFPLDVLSAPNWYVDAAAFTGEVVGVAGEGQGAFPNDERVNYGTVALGAGRVSFLGALLPDPVNDGSALYGVDSFATTYTGNQLLRNMLGWDVVFAQTPVAVEALAGRAEAQKAETSGATTGGEGANVPVPGIVAVLVALAAVALVRRRA